MNFSEENEYIEHKESSAEREAACDDVAAILNKHYRGKLYFGTKSDGSIIGQIIGINTLKDISQTLTNKIEPKIYPTLKVYEILDDGEIKEREDLDRISEDKFVPFKGVVEVIFSGREIPYSSRGRYFKRVGEEDKQVTLVELKKMFSIGRYEPAKFAEAFRQDLTFKVLKRELENNGVNFPTEEAMLKNLNLKIEDKFNLYAELVSDQCSLSIKAVRFEGKDKTYLPHINEFGNQSLIAATMYILQFATTMNRVKSELIGTQRINTYLFDLECFREARLNAVVHTNYLEMTPPAVYFFNDHLEIVSHGGLPYDLSLDDFFSNTSEPVNPTLFEIFSRVNLGDKTGHGVSKIVKKYGKDVFIINEKFVKVSLPYAFIPDFAYASSIPSSLTPLQREVLFSFINNSEISLKKLSLELNKPYGSILSAVEALQDLKLLTREGSKKNGKRKVNLCS